jgi:hypothetical protein
MFPQCQRRIVLLRDIALGKMQHQLLRRYAQPPASLALHRRSSPAIVERRSSRLMKN